jgi:protein-S-isoprenylcysteine O-methyltransferase Ste14
MDAVRYYVALVLLVVLPPALLSWIVIHPLAGFWRRRGPVAAYLVVVGIAVAMGAAIYRFREPLLRVELGFSWALTIVGVVSVVCATVLERQYRRHLTVGTLLGLPELSDKRESRLLTEGIYARVRHPRYVGLSLEILGFALFANYLASYFVTALTLPVLYLIVVLEERELLERFGAEYEEYMRRVPRFLPRLGSGVRTP